MEPTRSNPLGTAPIGRLLPKFAIPSVIAFLVTSLYNIVDQIFIGQGVGYLGNAATTVAFPFVTASTAIALLMGIGTAANFNLNLGAGRRDTARQVAGTGLTVLAVLGVCLGLAAYFLRAPLLTFFAATPDVFPYAMTYTGIIAFGLPMVTFTTGASNMIRADGSPAYSMFCTLSGAVLNTILDPIFIFPLDMGVAGGALATVLGQALSLALALGYLLRTKIRTVPLTRADLRPKPRLLKDIFSLGMAPFFNQIAMLLEVVLNNTLTYYGAQSQYGSDIPLACVGVISKVNILVLGFTIGISQGCQPIFSFNYGAGKYSRVREAYRKAIIVATLICCVAFLCFQLFPRQIAGIFDSSGSQLYFQFSERYFRIFMLMTFVNAVQPITSNFFTSIGKAKKGILISLTRQVLFLIPLILLFPLLWGIDGVMYAGPIADTAALVVAGLLTWREMRRMPVQDKPQAV